MINSTTLWASQLAALNAQRTAQPNSISPTTGSGNDVFADLVAALSARSVTFNASGAASASSPASASSTASASSPASALAATSASANGNGSALGIVLPHPHGHGGVRGHNNSLINTLSGSSSNAATGLISNNLHLQA